MNIATSLISVANRIDRGRFVQATRSDNLLVFFDKSDDPISRWLNTVRAEGNRKHVFWAVGLARGLQIARNYAERHGNAEDLIVVQRQIESLINNQLLPAP